jgi:hypothetical protein
VHPLPHRATGVAPAVRLAAEVGVLGRVPNVRYDTARREPRVVSAPFPLVEVDTVAYSVPPELVGVTVEVRLPVDAGIVEVRHGGRTVAEHRLAPPGSPPVWDPAHRAAAEAIALAPHRRHLHAVPDPVASGLSGPAGLELGAGDYDVEAIDMGRYDLGCGCSGRGA